MHPPRWGDLAAQRMVVEQWRSQAAEAQRTALADVGAGVEVESGVVGGHDWEDALDSLGWEEAELLVIGSSRLGPVARVFLGSNSAKIVRSSPVPVVVVPRGADLSLEDTGEFVVAPPP